MRSRLRRLAEVLRQLPYVVSVVRQGGEWVASYAAEWRHFINAIQQNTPVESTLDDGRRALHVVIAAVESASLRQPVKVAKATPQDHSNGLRPQAGE